MAQDLREICRNHRLPTKAKLKAGHEERFLKKLDNAFPETGKTKSFYWVLNIAASVTLLFSIGAFFFYNKTSINTNTTIVNTQENNQNTSEKNDQITLGDLSPDLKKVEDYYLANINLTLAELQVPEEGQQVLDDYMKELADLNTEYNNLITELNTVGPNNQTVSALIQNLELRLQLLHRLKQTLNKLQKNENNVLQDKQI